MDKKMAGALGAIGALAAGSAQAAAASVPVPTMTQVTSYADLLKPIPNALALKKAEEAANNEAAGFGKGATVQEAQFVEPSPYYQYPYYYQYDPRIRNYRRYLRYNHHHHFYYNHHHHHHHRYYHHHHHHHHHHHNQR